MDQLKLPENINYTIGEVRGPTEIARKYKLHYRRSTRTN